MRQLFGLLVFITYVIGYPGHIQAGVYVMNDDFIGHVSQYIVREGETLYTIARAHDIGIVEIMAANSDIDVWLPQPGRVLNLPTIHILPSGPREGIVINLPELRLYYYMGTGSVLTFPIGIGKEGWQTPTGVTEIVKKRVAPVWIPPLSIRRENPGLPSVVPAGQNNPLGTHAINLGWQSIVIHGTNRPYGIGRRSSHGCIRLYPEDIPVLFEHVAIGTKVAVIDRPYKFGWQANGLWLEVMPEQFQADEIMAYGAIKSQSSPDGLIATIIKVTKNQQVSIDWQAVEEAIENRTGLPVLIGKRTGK